MINCINRELVGYVSAENDWIIRKDYVGSAARVDYNVVFVCI